MKLKNGRSKSILYNSYQNARILCFSHVAKLVVFKHDFDALKGVLIAKIQLDSLCG